MTTDAYDMLEDCNKRYSKMNDWERGFIDSLSQLHNISKISANQYETLEKIWEKVT